MNIDAVVKEVKSSLDSFPQDGVWDEDCTDELIGEVMHSSDVLLDEDAELLTSLVYTALYALTLADARFDQWRFEFVNEMH